MNRASAQRLDTVRRDASRLRALIELTRELRKVDDPEGISPIRLLQLDHLFWQGEFPDGSQIRAGRDLSELQQELLIEAATAIDPRIRDWDALEQVQVSLSVVQGFFRRANERMAERQRSVREDVLPGSTEPEPSLSLSAEREEVPSPVAEERPASSSLRDPLRIIIPRMFRSALAVTRATFATPDVQLEPVARKAPRPKQARRPTPSRATTDLPRDGMPGNKPLGSRAFVISSRRSPHRESQGRVRGWLRGMSEWIALRRGNEVDQSRPSLETAPSQPLTVVEPTAVVVTSLPAADAMPAIAPAQVIEGEIVQSVDSPAELDATAGVADETSPPPHTPLSLTPSLNDVPLSVPEADVDPVAQIPRQAPGDLADDLLGDGDGPSQPSKATSRVVIGTAVAGTAAAAVVAAAVGVGPMLQDGQADWDRVNGEGTVPTAPRDVGTDQGASDKANGEAAGRRTDRIYRVTVNERPGDVGLERTSEPEGPEVRNVRLTDDPGKVDLGGPEL